MRRVSYHWVELHLPAAGSLLDVLHHQARSPIAAEVTWPVSLGTHPPGGLALQINGPASVHPTPLAALEAAYRRLHGEVLRRAQAHGWIRLHAATVDIGRTRLLLAGPSGIGKTTLAARLLADGHGLQGDEAVFIRSGESLALPRRLHVREPTLHLVPSLRVRPATLLPYDPPLWTIDPTAGLLRTAAVDHVVLLRRDGAPGSTPVPTPVLLDEVLTETVPFAERHGQAVRELAAVLRRAQCHQLHVTDLERAADDLRALATAG
jgi:hypothetical protein